MSILAFLPIIASVLDKIIPDPEARNKAKAEIELALATSDLQKELKQLDINVESAKSSSVFVAGARPAILWVCTSIFAYHYLCYPLLTTILHLHGVNTNELPLFNLEAIWPVLGGLLGLSGLRSFDKYNGVVSGLDKYNGIIRK